MTLDINSPSARRRGAGPSPVAGAWLALALLLLPPAAPGARAEETAAEPVPQSNSLLGSYLAGKLAQDLRDTRVATEFYKQALARDPGSEVLQQQAFLAEIMAGNWPRAVVFAERVVQSDPGNRLAHLVLAVSAFKSGRLGEAEKQFDQAGAGPITILARAWVLAAKKETKRSLALLDTLKDQSWIRFFRNYHRGLIADLGGDPATADAALSDLFKSEPRTLNVALALARHASSRGDAARAKSVLERQIEAAGAAHPLAEAALAALARGEVLPPLVTSPQEGLADVLYGFGEALSGEGGVDLGLIYLQLALQLRPDDPLTLISLASIYETVKRYDEAIDTYRRVPKGSPVEFDVNLRAALNLNALDRDEEAQKVLLGLIEKPADQAAAKAAMEAALRAEVEAVPNLAPGDRGENVRRLQALLVRAGLPVGTPDGLYGRATQSAVRSLQKAAAVPETGTFGPQTRKILADKLVAAMPATQAAAPDVERQIDLFRTLGNILRGRNKLEEAAKYYSEAIKLAGPAERKDWDEYYSRGVCYERLGRWAEAEADFLKSIELNPDEPVVLNYLGYSWVDRGENIDRALELIKKAVSLKPDDGYYVDSLGWAYYRMGRWSEAVEQLEKAVELRADDATINEHLGDAYWKSGRRLEARFQWSTALTLKPKPEDEARLKGKLESGLADDQSNLPAAAGSTTQKQADGAGAGQPKTTQP